MLIQGEAACLVSNSLSENPDLVDKSCVSPGKTPHGSVRNSLELDEERRSVIAEVESLHVRCF